jgi:hypothetical protein
MTTATTNAPEVSEVRSSGPGRGSLPRVGPFDFVARDTTRSVGKNKFRIVVYGAYNAGGLIGPEMNGIGILQESPPAVVADGIEQAQSGYFGPSEAQLAMFETLRTCTAAEFRALVNKAERLRFEI